MTTTTAPRLELPSGRWVEFGPLSEISERQRRPIRVLMGTLTPDARRQLAGGDVALETITARDQELMYELHDLIAAGVITACSWTETRPTAAEIADLPAADYDFLAPHVGDRIPSFLTGVDFDPTPDRASPTQPSSA